MQYKLLGNSVFFISMVVGFLPIAVQADEFLCIQPYAENSYYWQYEGKPVLLLGGSKDDNLFQIPDLEAHLDLVKSVGGNYIRNTMSSRDPENSWAFRRLDSGLYDLNQWNPEYWKRFERLLEMTWQRGIIVQIELWDPWDTYAETWKRNAWNPENNINYAIRDTYLAVDYPRPQYRDGSAYGKPHDFFLSPPSLQNDRLLLRFQQRFVEKVLSYTLDYPHVLYCITNEIHPQYPPEWGWYWAAFIREHASGKQPVFIAEMFWIFDFQSDQHRATFDHPDVYDFFEASQNSATRGSEAHWENLQFARQRLASQPRPINHTKTYGADTGAVWTGTDRDAVERFWRNLIGGAASCRFHRPSSGLGIGETAQRQLRSARMLTEEITLFSCEPKNDLLTDREENEAYCLAEPGKQYAVYFPVGGEVQLDVSDAKGELRLKWLNIQKSEWREEEKISSGDSLTLKAPGEGHWAALVQAQ
jgi:hypothetical protein